MSNSIMGVNGVAEYAKEDSGFYPTPPDIAEKMLRHIDWDKTVSVLEPSAGKGNLVDAIIRKVYARRGGSYWKGITGATVDCIERDEHLRSIIEHEYCGPRCAELSRKAREISNVSYRDQTEQMKSLHAQYDRERRILEATPVHVVSDDFLLFTTHKHYDAIIMNPPFENGDEHLMHALDIIDNGGVVVCLLNAETIRNPYTNIRKVLADRLNKYNAEIEYISDGFAHAERKTNVEIALVTVHVPEKKRESFIFDDLKRAKEQKNARREATAITNGDFVERIVEQFNYEVEGTLRLIREYEAIKPYMLSSFDEKCTDAILTLSLARDRKNYKQVVDENAYLKIVRLKYWRELFRKKEFSGVLTKNLNEKYTEIIESMGDYDFTLYNIQTFYKKMMAELASGVNDTILALFDKLSEAHSWYPECDKNIHYFNGWATNKAHMINTKKVIIPTYGVFSTYSWSEKEFNANTAYDTLTDIEKVFNYLDKGTTAGPDMWDQLRVYSESRLTKKIPLKYFWVTFYKKGTCHIEWRVPELVDKLNIYGCQRKNWLPPCYGKKHYSDMTKEEKAVIDEFQGEKEYEKVLEHLDYYLADDTAQIQLLPEVQG